MNKFFPSFLVAVFLSACNNSTEEVKQTSDSITINRKDSSSIINKDTANIRKDDPPLLSFGKQVIDLIRDKKFLELSTLVNPMHGLTLSADGYISKEDIVLGRRQLANAWNDTTHYPFPTFNESEPMRFSEYYRDHIYDKDFAKAPVIETNTLQRGPTAGMINVKEIYPNASFVTFYFPPSKDGELDWTALHLVFEKYGPMAYLRHIIHDRWTP